MNNHDAPSCAKQVLQLESWLSTVRLLRCVGVGLGGGFGGFGGCGVSAEAVVGPVLVVVIDPCGHRGASVAGQTHSSCMMRTTRSSPHLEGAALAPWVNLAR
ncbi:MAG: hypothetical protein IT196_28220 [Acidimicrobiales bacterium]|nr:hypothetical protein [Acidimicrobiales bacterium]